MLRKLSFALLLLTGFSACNKANLPVGCDANQNCTLEFRSLGVTFVDKDGNNIAVKDISVTNLRTNTAVVAKNVIDPGFSPNTYYVATDSNKDEFSTEGDDIKITATSTATNKTVSAALKISGGCNCHINKLSGPEKIVFE
nr:hypothetical protein [uncultured Mucilaginibacter sp.]